MTVAHPSDSAAWRNAETALLQWLSTRDGISLAPRKFPLPEGGHVELDGYSDEPRVLCEVYSRLGRVAGSTVYKACADAMKLVWLRDTEFPGARVVLLIANEELERRLTAGRGWRPQMLRTYGVEIIRAPVDQATLAALEEATKSAQRGMIPPNLVR